MDHFVIYSEDNPAPAMATLSLSERLQLEGNYIYVNKQHFPILAEDNAAELVTVHVAAARRYGTIDTVAADVPFSLTQGAVA